MRVITSLEDRSKFKLNHLNTLQTKVTSIDLCRLWEADTNSHTFRLTTKTTALMGDDLQDPTNFSTSSSVSITIVLSHGILPIIQIKHLRSHHGTIFLPITYIPTYATYSVTTLKSLLLPIHQRGYYKSTTNFGDRKPLEDRGRHQQ